MTTTADSPAGSRLTPLDPWTVYGEAAHATGGLATVDVPDIGVLPPASRYRGTVRSGAGLAPATLVVPPVTEASRQDRCRRIVIHSCDLPNDGPGSPVAITFKAIL